MDKWPWAWMVFTLVAASAQTVRNATQRGLTRELGTVGATHVRFLFGFPFALLFLAGVWYVSGREPPSPSTTFLGFVAAGAATQIVGTAAMLAAMGERSFLVAIAYTKTEPVQVALFGLLVLADPVTPTGALAILVATTGVVVMSVRPGVRFEVRSMALGLTAAAFFALSAIGFRGAILALDTPDFLLAATTTLATGLGLQAVSLTAFLAVRDRAVLRAIAAKWRGSLLAGFMGALASQFWFTSFALTSAANVRTLALVEVLFAQAVSFFVFGQKTTSREVLGAAAIVGGVVLLLASH